MDDDPLNAAAGLPAADAQAAEAAQGAAEKPAERPEPRAEREAEPGKKDPDYWSLNWPRLWPLLNSSFGLWVLSSIMLSGLTTCVSSQVKKHEQQNKRVEQAEAAQARRDASIGKLDLEIGYRLSTLLLRLDKASKAKAHAAASSEAMSEVDRVEQAEAVACADSAAATCKSTLSALDEAFMDRSARTSMYPEFASYSTVALVSELERLVEATQRARDADKASTWWPWKRRTASSPPSVASSEDAAAATEPDPIPELKQVISDMSGLRTMLLVQRAPLDDPTKVAGAILRKLVKRRWQQGFYYLDCPPQAPFC